MAKKILIVDDEPSIATAFSKAVAADGYQVIAVGDGEAALEKVKSEKPDLVILDIMLPGMDGHEVLKTLRQDGATYLMPVIMLTVKRGADDIVTSMIHGGALDYITKPFSQEELVRKVKNILGE